MRTADGQSKYKSGGQVHMLKILFDMENRKHIDYQKYIDEDTLPPHINHLHIPVPVEDIEYALRMHNNDAVAEGDFHYSVVAGHDETLESLLAGVRPDAFQFTLSQFIDRYWRQSNQHGYACIYNEAGISRQLFSKMFAYPNEEEHTPRKENIFKLAVVLNLSLPEARRLLDTKGYSISAHDRFDVVMKYCIEHHIRDKFDIDDKLLTFCGRTLFSVPD
jgi:hypothetical protein